MPVPFTMLANNSVADILLSRIAIIAYIAIIVVAIVAITVLTIRNSAKNDRIVHKVSLPDKIALPVNVNGASKADTGEEGERSRFYMLCEIDANRGKYQKTGYEEGITLRSFCEEFRNFACSKLKLYYSIEDIRRFVAGLAVSKITILQGMSGTGKTSLAYAIGEFLGNPSTVIPVQPMWKERTDLVGYYNEFTKRFNETLLLNLLVNSL